MNISGAYVYMNSFLHGLCVLGASLACRLIETVLARCWHTRSSLRY